MVTKDLVDGDKGRVVMYRSDDGLVAQRGVLQVWNGTRVKVKFPDMEGWVKAECVSFIDTEDVAKELMDEKKATERFGVKVETYEIGEVLGEGGFVVTSPEAQKLAEEMGLEGQKRLSVDGKKAMPYRKLSKADVLVYRAAFPDQVELAEFDLDYLPLRVLQVARHAAGDLFKKIEVWSVSKSSGIEALLVGFTTKEWGKEDPHLLARWGRLFESYDALKKEAGRASKVRYKTKLSVCAKEVSGVVASIDDMDDESFLDVDVPNFYSNLR